MITCKEDLLNTQASGDLVVPFQELAFKFGVGWSPNGHAKDIYPNYEVVTCKDYGCGPELACSAELVENARVLTLSDLKPRTKVEYEKVTESIFDLKDEFECGELYYNFGDDEWFTFKDEPSFAIGFKEGNVYRKVERPVEWWEDAVEFLNAQGGFDACGNKEDGLWIRFEDGVCGVSMSRDKWCDFARIILEQEGE